MKKSKSSKTRKKKTKSAKTRNKKSKSPARKKKSRSSGTSLPKRESGSRQPRSNHRDDQEAATEIDVRALRSACPENPPPWTGKPWRTAEALKAILGQINALAPGRSKVSDGAIGDLNHQRSKSDHNPWVLDGNKGVVTAMDITHDPAKGCSCEALSKSLENGKDTRVKYVIWNRQIMNSSSIGSAAPWTWRPYAGANPHDKHIHISVKCEKSFYDSTSAWSILTQ